MLLNMAVFGAALSYVLMMVSHIVLRVREPNMTRPYRTPGGIVTTSFALVVAALSVVATFVVDSTAAFLSVVFAAFRAYFGLYSRHGCRPARAQGRRLASVRSLCRDRTRRALGGQLAR